MLFGFLLGILADKITNDLSNKEIDQLVKISGNGARCIYIGKNDCVYLSTYDESTSTWSDFNLVSGNDTNQKIPESVINSLKTFDLQSGTFNNNLKAKDSKQTKNDSKKSKTDSIKTKKDSKQNIKSSKAKDDDSDSDDKKKNGIESILSWVGLSILLIL
ncbi:hypothetical protein A0H76_2455 [Hepatospora eriocheir]|uniref:Uncharacterized protein n=1 Tax=Hepatospora eriocheir TaxID=1081669 RepID=A0A1X0QFM1_9MICR|nr:hypothetical protein A0H76_2455 [Hepatospora eriocheir]